MASNAYLLMQVVLAMLDLDSRRRIYLTGRELQLVESMVMECLEDPRPLLRRYLGRHHLLIRAEFQAFARAPPGEGESADT